MKQSIFLDPKTPGQTQRPRKQERKYKDPKAHSKNSGKPRPKHKARQVRKLFRETAENNPRRALLTTRRASHTRHARKIPDQKSSYP